LARTGRSLGPYPVPVHRLQPERGRVPVRLRDLLRNRDRRRVAAADDRDRGAALAPQPPSSEGCGRGTRARGGAVSPTRAVLRRGFDRAERVLDHVFGADWNPLGQLGPLGWFLFWVVAVTGAYLFIFFDTGVVNAYTSVEWLTHDHWVHAGLARSLHRYASDLLVLVMLLHLAREFANDRYRGRRWFSWLTGVPIL